MERRVVGARVILMFALAICAQAGLPPELECPEDCDCHYFRVNWVTDCSESNLTNVPTLGDGLSLNVYTLILNGNNLTSTDWKPFADDIKMRSLKLADNRLMKITKDMFAGLKYLIDLDISGNVINHIEPEAFSDSAGLISLELQSNHFEDITGPFLASKSLLTLGLADCSLRHLNSAFFTDTPNLNTLDLSGNPLSGDDALAPGVFDPLGSLHELSLSRCNISSLVPATFAKLSDLKKLELSGNSLYAVTDWTGVLQPLVRLEYLDLSRSGIQTLPEGAFDQNQWLRNLLLAGNILRDLDVATTLGHNLKHLDFLDLTDCRIIGPLSEQAFANATQLRTLILNGNPMSAADLAVALSPLSRLQKLSLRNCSLTRLPPKTFHKFPSLQELDVSHNPLNDAFTSLLNPLTSLLHLDMSFSHLGTISKPTFQKMTSLKSLILSGNPLVSLESGLFQHLTHLETLELKNCGLSRLNATVFHESSHHPDLKKLVLAGNPLEISETGSFLPKQLNQLHILDLSYCGITRLPPPALESCANLTELYLGSNALTYDAGEGLAFLANLPNIKRLDIGFNKLNRVTPVDFRHNPDLNWLMLVGNPWDCGCHIADLWEWAQVVKGDLSILVGSTPGDQWGKTNPKRRNALLCTFNSKTSPIKSRRQKFLVDNVNRTWARYVRESACDSSQHIVNAKFLEATSLPPRAEALVGEKLSESSWFEMPPSRWAWSAVMGLTVAGGLVLLSINYRRDPPRHLKD